MQLLQAVAAGADDARTGRVACEFRMAIIAGGPSGSGMLPAHPGLGREERLESEKALLTGLRQLNLSTWAASACGVLTSHAELTKGTPVLVHGLQSRSDLNGTSSHIQARRLLTTTPGTLS